MACSLAKSSRQAFSKGGRSSRTTRHSTSYATRSYSWRSTLPIPATFDHGISGCLAFRSSLRCRLASEMISIPRSTSQRLRVSNSRLWSVMPANSPRISSTASMMSVRRAIGDGVGISTLACRGLDLRAQNRMQAAPRHDVGSSPKDSGGRLFHIHQFEKPERPLGKIKEQIDIRIVVCLVSRGRAEQIEMLDAEPLQLDFVLFELGDSFAAFHRSPFGSSRA